jgi:hypothetical protein
MQNLKHLVQQVEDLNFRINERDAVQVVGKRPVNARSIWSLRQRLFGLGLLLLFDLDLAKVFVSIDGWNISLPVRRTPACVLV